MKEISYLFCLFFFCFGFSQSNILNAEKPQEIGKVHDSLTQIKLLKYDFIDDKDIMWSRIVYEEIDLTEKFNHPLYFPENESLYRDERKSLWRVIREAIKSKKIKNIYSAKNLQGDIFYEKFTEKEYLDKIEYDGAVLSSKNISSYVLKGIWYVDKRYTQLQYRLLGILPYGDDIKLINKKQDKDSAPPEPKPLFWLWYKDLRPILAKNFVFDDRNNASRITFDQLLTSRRFTSRIIGVDNVFDDKSINQYVDDPFMQLIESERLKNVIRDFEQDLWSN